MWKKTCFQRHAGLPAEIHISHLFAFDCRNIALITKSCVELLLGSLATILIIRSIELEAQVKVSTLRWLRFCTPLWEVVELPSQRGIVEA